MLTQKVAYFEYFLGSYIWGNMVEKNGFNKKKIVFFLIKFK